MIPVQVSPKDVLMVAFDFTHGERHRICIVGKKNGTNVEIINAFEGQKAMDIFNMLTKQQEVQKED